MLGLFTLLFVISCSKNNQTAKKDDDLRNGVKPFSGILVTDEFGVPLSDVKVLIGSKPDVPFANNIFVSGPSGEIGLPDEWSTPETVTLVHSEYVTTSYLNISPGPLNFRMRLKSQDSNLKIKGEVKKFTKVDQDGMIDLGLVFPAIRVAEIINFSINDYISPNTDEISVLGQKLKIPSNISIPAQTEWYGFIRIRLNKPEYSIRVNSLGVHHVAAVQARFDLSDMIREARKSDLDPFTLLNMIEFKNGNAQDVIFNSGSRLKKNIDVSGTKFPINTSHKMTAFTQNDMVLGISLIRSGFKYYPSDIKLLNGSTETDLKSDGDPRGKLVYIQRGKDTETTGPSVDRLSGKILPNNQSQSPQMLTIIPQPIAHSDIVSSTPPTKVNHIETGSVAILSQLSFVDTGSVKYEKKQKLWEVYRGDWNGDFELPDWSDAEPRQAGLSYRWEVIYLADDQNPPTNNSLGPQIFENSTDFSKNAIDFVY